MKKIASLFVALSIVAVLVVTTSFLPQKTENESSAENKFGITFPAGTPENVRLPDTIPPQMIEELNAMLNKTTYACTIYYMDLVSGLRIEYNSDREFAAASLIKGPYVLYILEMIADGKLSLDTKLTYNASKHYLGGTGTIQRNGNGKEYTIKQLIEEIVKESDNCAFKMLYTEILSIPSFSELAVADFNAKFYSSTYGNIVTSGGVGRMFTEMYRRWSEKDELFEWYVEKLKFANENKFVKDGLPHDENNSCLYEVAHKYGMDIKASNDAAIVFYEDRPYVLVILTDYLYENTKTFMNEVSAQIFKIHEYISSITE